MSTIVPREPGEFFTVTFPLSGAAFLATRRDGRLLLQAKDVTECLEYADGGTAQLQLPASSQLTLGGAA